MKRLAFFASVAMLLTWLTVGCQKETEPGGPGADGTNTVDSAKTFTLSVPDGTNVQQDKQTEVSVSINPGSEFKEQVTVTFEPPAGITIEPAELMLSKDNKTEGKLTIKADATATEGDHTVKVIGKPATGEVVSDTFKVTVDKGDAAAPPADGEGDPLPGT